MRSAATRTPIEYLALGMGVPVINPIVRWNERFPGNVAGWRCEFVIFVSGCDSAEMRGEEKGDEADLKRCLIMIQISMSECDASE